MSKRRAAILQVARELGATWRMSGQSRRYLEHEDPGLCRILDQLDDLTKEEPRGEPMFEGP